MGTPTWPQLPALIEELLADASSFDFFQALQLVETLRGRPGAGLRTLERWLRVRPVEDLGFPAADLRDCQLDDDGRLILRTGMLGLYGVDAALPHYFLDQVSADDDAAPRFRAFLDIFNHRLYVLLYLAWRSAQPFADGTGSAYQGNVAAACGRLEPGIDELPAAAAAGRKVRTAAGLERVLQGLLEDTVVEVHDRLPQWVELEQPALGGAGPALGVDSVLGGAMLVAGGRLRIDIGELDVATAQALLPQQEAGRQLLQAASRYLDHSRDFDLVLKVAGGSERPCRLGEGDVRLGWSSWLGERVSQGYEIRIGGEQLHEQQESPAAEAMPRAA